MMTSRIAGAVRRISYTDKGVAVGTGRISVGRWVGVLPKGDDENRGEPSRHGAAWR